jgi:hypothetical protein
MASDLETWTDDEGQRRYRPRSDSRDARLWRDRTGSRTDTTETCRRR